MYRLYVPVCVPDSMSRNVTSTWQERSFPFHHRFITVSSRFAPPAGPKTAVTSNGECRGSCRISSMKPQFRTGWRISDGVRIFAARKVLLSTLLKGPTTETFSAFSVLILDTVLPPRSNGQCWRGEVWDGRRLACRSRGGQRKCISLTPRGQLSRRFHAACRQMVSTGKAARRRWFFRWLGLRRANPLATCLCESPRFSRGGSFLSSSPLSEQCF